MVQLIGERHTRFHSAYLRYVGRVCARWSSQADNRLMCQREGQAVSGYSVESAAVRFHIARVCFAGCSTVLQALAGSYPYLHANPETAQNHPTLRVYYMLSQIEILTYITICDILSLWWLCGSKKARKYEGEVMNIENDVSHRRIGFGVMTARLIPDEVGRINQL